MDNSVEEQMQGFLVKIHEMWYQMKCIIRKIY